NPSRASGLFADVSGFAALRPRYNIAPSQPVAVIRRADGRLVLSLLNWGIVPTWAGRRTLLPNARAERVATAPAFRPAFRSRRCRMPADGFFDWAGPERPFLFRGPNAEPLAFAGLWDGGGCAVVTVPASADVQAVHPRMPALLRGDEFARWLDPSAGVKELR